ncbi:MAG TPA: hypothetical protein VKR82_01105 [Candidatus Acidoferrales bacterium]|nr:hypothetical protein [Candidatus Acidoferrales bacterium]
MKIPFFHDDQHGTAIISDTASLNAAVVDALESTPQPQGRTNFEESEAVVAERWVKLGDGVAGV